MKYRYTQHTVGHVTIAETDGKGEVVMVAPDQDEVRAIVETNQKNTRVYNTAKAGWKQGQPSVMMPAMIPIPQPQLKVKEVISMEMGAEYELPEGDAHVQHLLLLGHLEEIPVVVIPSVKKDEKPGGVVTASNGGGQGGTDADKKK